MQYQAVILAGGESSRFWPLNEKHKSLIKIMGRPLIWYTIEGLRKSGINKIIIIQNKEMPVERELTDYQFSKCKITYITQDKAKGMGDALWRGQNFIKTKFLVFNTEIVYCSCIF